MPEARSSLDELLCLEPREEESRHSGARRGWAEKANSGTFGIEGQGFGWISPSVLFQEPTRKDNNCHRPGVGSLCCSYSFLGG